MSVIINATPLIALAVVEQLELLPQIFGEVIVPTTVYSEVLGQGVERPGAQIIAQADWLQIVSPKTTASVEPLLLGLDQGEVDVLLLAREQQPEWVIIDERQARRVARAMGIPVKGTMGVLLAAGRTGGPALTGLTLSVTTTGNSQYLYTREMPPAFYYHQTASGTLTLTPGCARTGVTAADSQSGLAQMTFPHIFTASDGLPLPQTGQAGPETLTHTYNLVGSAPVSETLAVTASDKVDNLAAGQSFPVVQDTISPTVVITVPDRVPLIFDITCLAQSGDNHASPATFPAEMKSTHRVNAF